MTDRELLEKAAKAAGYKPDGIFGQGLLVVQSPGTPGADAFAFEPLTDDGDALRLAVKLGLTVAIKGHECEVFSEEGECLGSVPILGASCFVNPAEATNPGAATRSAITRAAAAIYDSQQGAAA